MNTTTPPTLPAVKDRELRAELARAKRERRTGTILVRLSLYKGDIKRAAVVADFDDLISDVQEPVCFAGESDPAA